MARIFITGSSDGLGLLTAKALIAEGHQVVVHARNEKRKTDTLQNLPDAVAVLIGDLASIKETKALALEANKFGAFDVVIHNAGVYSASGEELFAVNVLAPYILTSLLEKPKRLIYLTSDMHLQGQPKLENMPSDMQRINYSDSKLYVLMLCNTIARKWTAVYANAVNPGWVPTKMGGSQAPDNLQKGYETQVWLATSDDEEVKGSGRYFFHQRTESHSNYADNAILQNRLLDLCEQITAVSLP